jgi:NNP family nitrate/nitrite transporter-like MFS transporter
MAVAAMITFGLFTHMACGATYALVPFVDRKSLGGVAGIIGAGGNVGAVAAGFLLKGVGDIDDTFTILGGSVIAAAFCAAAIRFTMAHKQSEQALYDQAVRERDLIASPVLVPKPGAAE